VPSLLKAGDRESLGALPNEFVVSGMEAIDLVVQFVT
jgi:hypothetical protein